MVYVFLATGFEEVEALTAVDILRRAELEVKTVGIGGKNITGSHGVEVVCDLADEEADPRGVRMIVLPGGMPGTLNLERSKVVQGYLRMAVIDQLYIGAICAAPSILGHIGLLDGANMTCYPGFESQMPDAVYTGAAVERYGNIITSKGPGTAIEFALKLAELLAGEEKAAAVRASLQIA